MLSSGLSILKPSPARTNRASVTIAAFPQRRESIGPFEPVDLELLRCRLTLRSASRRGPAERALSCRCLFSADFGHRVYKKPIFRQGGFKIVKTVSTEVVVSCFPMGLCLGLGCGG